MIDREKFIEYVSLLSSKTSLKEWIHSTLVSKGLNHNFQIGIKQLYLHDFLNSSVTKTGYKSVFTLYDVLFGDYEIIQQINYEMKSQARRKDVNELVPLELKNALLSTFKNKYKRNHSRILIDSFNVKTCEYCQIQFTYGVYSTKKNTMVAHIDHIIPKSSNYLLTFSYGNFLISCPSCNSTFKGTKSTMIVDRNKVCPPELFSLKLTYEGLLKISSTKLSDSEFKILVDDKSKYYQEYLKLSDRVNCFKDYLSDYIHNLYGVSDLFKINTVLWSNGVLSTKMKSEIQKVISQQYDSFYTNEMGSILRSVKLAIRRDIKNHTYILASKL